MVHLQWNPNERYFNKKRRGQKLWTFSELCSAPATCWVDPWLLARWVSRHPLDSHFLQKIVLFFIIMLPYKEFIWAGPIAYLAHFGRPHFKFWLNAIASVVGRLDNTIHWIKLYPVNKCLQNKPRYPLDSDISSGVRYPPFKQPGPGWFFKIQ